MNNMAKMGRFGDDNIAHVSSGEMVIPSRVLNNSPDLKNGIMKAMSNSGLNPNQYTVGNPKNSINPMTGQPEFKDEWWTDVVRPLLGGAVLGPTVGSALGIKDAIIQQALGGGLTSALTGGSPLHGALVGGAGGGLGFNTGGLGKLWNVFGTGKNQMPINSKVSSGLTKKALDKGMEATANEVAKKGTFLGDFMKTMGLGDDSIAFKIANNPIGQSLLAGGLAQLLSGGEDDSAPNNLDYRKFGTGIGFKPTPLIDYGKQGSVLKANMGGNVFPRRDGGIMPYEGGGRVDDVPAMLTAGEFVLTKDAVNGLGGGDQNLGIQRAYNMMNSLERMA